MLTMDRKAKIRYAVLVEGKSQRTVAKELGHSRNTIRKALKDSRQPVYKQTQPRSAPVLGPYKKLLANWVAEDAQKPKKKRRTAQRMFQILQKEYDYQGAEPTLRAYVGKLRKRHKRKAYIPLAYDPGEVAQVDFGQADVIIAGQAVTAHLFVMWLGYSSATYVQAYPAETQEVFLAGHVAAFTFWGGVPREIWYDNLKSAVNKVLKGRNREESDSFISLRTHYLFQAQFCNIRSGWEKGGVEGRVGYTRRNWLIPPPEFDSWAELNAYLEQQCRQEQTRQLRGQTETIGQRLATEQAHFLPVPAHPFPCCKTIPVRANKLALVSFATNRYSVPTAYVQEKLLLRAYVDRVEISDGRQLVAVHRRCWQREQDILNPHHYLTLLAQRPRAFAQAQPIREWQATWPAIFDHYWAALKERHELTEATRLFIAVLQLSQTACETDLAAALEQALQYRCFTPTGVAQLLRRQQESPPPPPVVLTNHPHLNTIEVQFPDLQQFNQLLSWKGSAS